MQKIDEEFEINRPHNAGRLYNFLINYKFQKALGFLPFPIRTLSLLDVCCGSGMGSEYYTRLRANVIGLDSSLSAIKRAKIRCRRYGFQADFLVGDAENLPFENNCFDVVSVHDGLHHLNNAKKAILEMTRVTKKGVVIIEPAKALGTRISVLLGVSKDYEDVGNFVYRFRKDELTSWLKEAEINKIITKRYIMYYPHKPGIFFKILGSCCFFYLCKAGFYLLNVLMGKFGNKIQVIGLK